MPGSNSAPKTQRWLVIFLLLFAFYVRAHHIMALPPFNDESHHIRRAERVWSFEDPTLSFTVGKLLTYYWIGIFNPDRLDAIWVGRTVISLFALLGLAGTYAISRRLFGQWGGVLALYIAAFSPFMIFFDRLAFSDSLTATLGILVVWASLLMLRHPDQQRWGILAGILISLTILAKLIGAPFAAIPLWAVLILTPQIAAAGASRRAATMARLFSYRKTLIACYVTIGAILTPFFLWIVYKEISGNRISVVDPNLINTASPIETISNNIGDLLTANWILNSPFLMIAGFIAVVVALRFQPRVVIFLLGCSVLVWSLTVFSAGRLSTRYLQIGVLPLLILSAGSLVIAFQRLPEQLKFLRVWAGSWGIATIWLLMFAQPFISAAWTEPRLLKLPDRDRFEYFSNFTSGYGLMEASAVAQTLEPSITSGKIPLIGLVGSCHQIRLYLDEFGAVYLECPAFGWEGEFMDEVAQYIDYRLTQESVLYLLVEPDLPYTDLNKLHVRHQVIGRFERPFEGMTVELWQVFP